jgi:hypothetical protein
MPVVIAAGEYPQQSDLSPEENDEKALKQDLRQAESPRDSFRFLK